MANQYWDVGQFITRPSGKKFFQRLGSATARDDGGFWVNLDALPTPQEGKVTIVIAPPRDNERPAPRRASPARNDDDIPF